MEKHGEIRRMDLNLRSDFPDINTTIYKVEKDRYSIYCDKIDGNFKEFVENFEHTIRMFGPHVELTQTIPANFLEVIPGISDKEIAKNFEGLSWSASMLLNLLIAKFPNIYFHKVETAAPGSVNIHIASFEEKLGNDTYLRFLNNRDREKVMEFLAGFNVNIAFNLVENKLAEMPKLESSQFHNPVQNIFAASFRRDTVFDFSLRDEALWFDNIDKIFEGTFSKKDLYFYNENEYSCYIDYSSFENIDIRNVLFLYQTVYVTLPFEKSIQQWLNERKITKNEFLDLVKRKRVKVVLLQPEYRYDINFIKEAFEANPLGVISRRALAALQQIDVVNISDNYLLNDNKSLSELKSFCQIIGDSIKINPKFLFEILAWPIKARRNSFESLNIAGTFATSNFGVNNAIEKRISESTGKDLSFEFVVNASAIHLAHALNATYFPFKTKEGYSDIYYANVMGELLNFYKSANITNMKSFVENKQRIKSGILPISPIDLIEVNDYLSITELEKIVSNDISYSSNKQLIVSLSTMSDVERKKKIQFYNEEVAKKINKKGRSDSAIDLGTNVLLDAAGAYTGIGFIGSAFSLLKITGKRMAGSIPMIKNITTKIDEAFYGDIDKANIHYLTQINRVARVKRNV